ncbi:MAG: glycosyltransferase family 2 protein [Pseudomonadota bacterium]
MELAFTSASGSVFECNLAFNTYDYANLNFHDFARQDVPFHLSFRFGRQIVVYNQFLSRAWGPERSAPVELKERGNTIRVEVSESQAVLHVNGARTGTYDLPEPTDGTHAALHWVSVNGGVEDVVLSGPSHDARRGRGLLSSERSFLLDGWGFDPGSVRQDLRVILAKTGEPLPSAMIPAPERATEQRSPSDDIGIMALIPGWVWQSDAVEGASVALQLMSNARACGPSFVLTRDEIIETIERVCEQGAEGNSLEVLTALEHTRFAALGSDLSPKAVRVLGDVAARYKVTDFYSPQDNAHTQTARGTQSTRRDRGATGAQRPITKAGHAIDLVLPPAQAMLKAISARMENVPPEDLASVVRSMGLDALSERDLRTLMLTLAHNFCDADRMEDLYALAQDYGVADMNGGAQEWALSVALPFCLLRAQADAVVYRVSRLAEFDGWIDSCAVGWTVRQVIARRAPCLSEVQHEEVVDGFLNLLLALEGNYYSQLPSVQFTACAVALIEELTRFSEDLQDRILDTIDRIYATSPAFWDRLAEIEAEGGMRRLPYPLEDARGRFNNMLAALEEGEPLRATSQLLRRHSEALRLRRELAAASRAAGTDLHDALAAAEYGAPVGSHEADDALLRHLAFPSEASEAPDLATRSRRAIRKRSSETPVGLHPDQQASAGRHARALLGEALGDAAAREEMLDRFFIDCTILSSWRDEYLGYALAVSLLTGALTNQDRSLADAIPGRIVEMMVALREGEIDSLTAAPALRNALWDLRQAPGSSRSDAAGAVFALFEAALETLPAPFEDKEGSLFPKTGIQAFFGVLVVIYSCKPYLETRINALRDWWLKDLEAWGISYVVVVGDGDGRREGDVVHLDVSDSYESLPHKTLAMTEWALSQTGYSHIYKIDDDCFMNPAEAIGSLSYKKYPYYGRRLVRPVGWTARAWHHSQNVRGKAALELDKSPEPAEYGDGSTGYLLNREAMQSLIDTARSRHGAWLRLVSIFEDKLVGDMLALAGIRIANRDYHACVLRRNRADGVSVSRWENTFLPSKSSPTLIAHLDRSDLQAVASETTEAHELLPKRVWPGYARVKLGPDNLQVELLSSVERLNSINSEALCVIACMRNERDMLPMFLAHYRALGVRGFLIADNCSDDGTLEFLLEQPDVVAFSAEADYGTTQYGVAWQQALLSNLRMNRWSLVADADEFLVLPDGVPSLPQLLETPGFHSADCARIFMLDLYPEGRLSEATLDSGDPFAELTHCDREPFICAWSRGQYANAETWTSAVRHRLLEGSRRELYVAQKYALIRYRPWMRFTAGLHAAAETTVAAQDLVFAHFKYHAAFHERARVETARGQHFNDAEEYRKYLALMSEGRDRIFEPGVSVPWRECGWVRRVLSQHERARAAE